MKPTFHTLSIQEVRQETPDCVSIAFALPNNLKDTFQFEAGQYLTVRAHINDEEVRRSYSICSAPYEQELRVAVKHVPNGLFSTYANQQLQAGDTLEVMPPMGRFTLRDEHPEGHYVFFAAGSGITPVISLIKTILSDRKQSRCTLFYGNRSFDSIIFREEIEGLKNKHLGRLAVHHILSRETLGSPLFSGRIDAEKCASFSRILFDPKTVNCFYICGPEEMIFSVRDSLQAGGLDAKNIYFELFTSPGQKKKKQVTNVAHTSAEESSKVTITLDQKSFDMEVPYKGMNILDAALAKGADLPYACKGGVCCTCRAKVLYGKVQMDVNYALEAEEVEAGFVLSCQSHPTTPEVGIDFDVR